MTDKTDTWQIAPPDNKQVRVIARTDNKDRGVRYGWCGPMDIASGRAARIFVPAGARSSYDVEGKNDRLDCEVAFDEPVKGLNVAGWSWCLGMFRLYHQPAPYECSGARVHTYVRGSCFFEDNAFYEYCQEQFAEDGFSFVRRKEAVRLGRFDCAPMFPDHIQMAREFLREAALAKTYHIAAMYGCKCPECCKCAR